MIALVAEKMLNHGIRPEMSKCTGTRGDAQTGGTGVVGTSWPAR